MKAIRWGFIAGILLMLSFPAWAALPLLTDDTGTQGSGKFQIEVGGEYDHERETVGGVTVKETDYVVVPTFTYGLLDRVDLFAAAPYARTASAIGTEPTLRVGGISDTAIGVKWRFFDRQGSSLAVKPFVTFSTGKVEKGLGTGRTDYGVVLIVSRDVGPWSFHANVGYTRNENRVGDRKDLWLVSAASTYEVVKDLKLCADIGTVTNTDTTSEVEPLYLLGGVIYSVSEDLELSFAFKHGLNDPETDWSLLPGITYRF